MENKKFNNLDMLRTIAAISILLMHILYVNFEDLKTLPVLNLISSAGKYVHLFFIISGFGLCCGYYEKFKDNKISINEFYKKRYLKLLPFFSILVIIDVIYSSINNFSTSIIYEAFSDLTLLFAFFPNSNIEVIGVAWSLGVIFAFYVIFPFFVFLIWNKKRAIFSFIISLALCYLCSTYFTVDGGEVRCNLLRWLCYFILGGIIYLYRNDIRNIISKLKILVPLIVIAVTIITYFIPDRINNFEITTLKTLLVFGIWVAASIGKDNIIMSNPITKFMSSISFEIYISHTFIYRVLEKLKLVNIFKNDIASYICTSALVLVGAIIFSIIVKNIVKKFFDSLRAKGLNV